MPTFRDIWNLVVTGDTSDIHSKLGSIGKKAEETGVTVDTTFRGRMGNALGDFAQKIPGVSGLMDKFGVSSSQAGALMGTAVAGGVALAGEKVAAFVEKSIGEYQKQSQEVLHFKEVSNLAAEEASKFVAVAEKFGVSAEDLSTAIGKMDKAAGTTPQKLEALGIELGKNAKGGYDAEQTFLNVVTAFNATDDASRKAAIGSTAFGKGWQSVIKVLEQSSGSLKQSFKDVKDFQIFNEKDLQQSEDYRLKMQELEVAVKGFEREVGQAAIPVVTEFTRQLVASAQAADATLKPFGGLNVLLWAAATDINPAFESTGGSVAEVAKKLGQNAEVAARGAEALMMQIKGTALANEEYTRKINDNAEAMKDNQALQIAEANKAWGKAMEENKKKTDDATKALHDYRQAQHDLINDQLGLEGAFNTAGDAIAAFTAKTLDHTAKTNDLRDANLAARLSFEHLADQAVITAQKQADLAGATLSAQGAVDAQVSALSKLFANLASDSPLRKALDEYILRLYDIPGEIHTNVDLTGTDWNVGRGREGNTGVGPGAPVTPNATTGGGYVANIKAYESANGTAWRTGTH